MRRVAGNTADIISCVLGVDRIHVLWTARVAVQAPLVDFPRRRIFEGEDFRLVSAAVNVRFTRAVAPFAAVPLRPFFRV